MLLCQLCKQREATMHYTRIHNQQKVEMYVCEQCARENNGLNVNLHNLLTSIMGMQAMDEHGSFVVKKCSDCGMTLEEFNKTGMLGCNECYETFSDTIQTMLNRIHGNVRHHGKIPAKLSGKIKEANDLRLLKEELQQCIRDEDYEQAAQIRDKIKILEKG